VKWEEIMRTWCLYSKERWNRRHQLLLLHFSLNWTQRKHSVFIMQALLILLKVDPYQQSLAWSLSSRQSLKTRITGFLKSSMELSRKQPGRRNPIWTWWALHLLILSWKYALPSRLHVTASCESLLLTIIFLQALLILRYSNCVVWSLTSPSVVSSPL